MFRSVVRLVLLVSALDVATGPATAQADDDVATGAASFIRLGASARAIAMGRAFTALAGEDAAAMFWNPAGTALGETMRISLTDRFFGDGGLGMGGGGSFVSIGGSAPIGWQSSVGVAAMFFGVDGIEQYDERAQYQGDFSNRELLVMLSLAHREGPVATGINLKVIQQEFSGLVGNNLGTPKASAYGLDAGLITNFVKPLRIGVVVRSRADLEDDRVPLSATVGFAYERRMRIGQNTPRLVGALDFEQVKERPLRFHMGLGLEQLYSYREISFSLRLGRNNHFLENRLSRLIAGDFRDELEGEDLVGPNAQWTMGFGLERGRLGLDYSFVRGMLHDPHYMSLSYAY